MMPLDEIRVLELAQGWAGPTIGYILGDFGADVIKVEAVQRPDWWRTSGQDQSQPDWWETRGGWNFVNRNKRGITLDLTNPAGRDAFVKLAALSDVIIESFSSRVMENLGLTFDKLSAVNPRLIMLSMPAYGLTGPWRDYVGFGPSLEAATGLASMTGYGDGVPRETGLGVPDVMAGHIGLFAILLALRQRRSSGRGQLIDLSQTEASVRYLGERIVEASTNAAPPRQSMDPAEATHGIYRCRATDTDDNWIVISFETDAEFAATCDVIGRPDLAGDARLATLEGRQAHRPALDAAIADWTIRQDKRQAMVSLQEAGVTAGIVSDPRDMVNDPHLKSRGYFAGISRPITGVNPIPSPIVRASQSPAGIRIPAPTLGQHNEEILGGLLGMTDDELDNLRTRGVIGNAPI